MSAGGLGFEITVVYHPQENVKQIICLVICIRELLMSIKRRKLWNRQRKEIQEGRNEIV